MASSYELHVEQIEMELLARDNDKETRIEPAEIAPQATIDDDADDDHPGCMGSESSVTD